MPLTKEHGVHLGVGLLEDIGDVMDVAALGCDEARRCRICIVADALVPSLVRSSQG